MSRVRFIGDANFDQDIVAGLWRWRPEAEFLLPQDRIPEGATDPQVLSIAAQLDAVLVTHDVRTMPFHFADFIATSPSPGLIIVPRKLAISVAIGELALIWDASLSDEWVNANRRLPL